MAFLAVLLLAPAVQAQGAWADKLFDGKLSHDFGNIPRGAQLFYRFKLKNIYAVPLQIINARVSCGCVTVTPSDRTLPVHGETTIDVTMDSRRFNGQKTVTIYVTVGPEWVSTATLQVSAYSRADVVFNPGEVNFGVVPRGQSPHQTIDVEYAGALDWRVGEVVQNNSPVHAAFHEIYRRPGQVGYRVDVALKPDAPPGNLKEVILLRTNDPASPLVPIHVEGIVQAPLSVVPSTVNFGNVKVGDSVSKRVIVRGSRPFRVVAVEGTGDDVRANLPETPSETQVVTLTYQPGKVGDCNRKLLLRTDLSGEAPVSISLVGSVEGKEAVAPAAANNPR